MIVRAAKPWIGSALTVAVAVLVTAQAFKTERPRKARDLVAIPVNVQGLFADICRMYPGDCQFTPDGLIARVSGRRIAPGTDRAVINHFRTEIGIVQDESWRQPQ